MRPRRSNSPEPRPATAALTAVLAAVLTALTPTLSAAKVQAEHPADEVPERPALGLMTSLPIYWNEAADPSDLLAPSGSRHWARAALERDHQLVPLDVLDGQLAGYEKLVLAQPRALSPAENVALDDWVRSGGHLLLFTDPMLTGHSEFAFGDRRRPEAIGMLSPILARWGLEMQFDEAGPANSRLVELESLSAVVPVSQPGHLVARENAGGAAGQCGISSESLLADCVIGQGRVLVLADATLLEHGEDAAENPGKAAFEALLNRAFGISRTGCGKNGDQLGEKWGSRAWRVNMCGE